MGGGTITPSPDDPKAQNSYGWDVLPTGSNRAANDTPMTLTSESNSPPVHEPTTRSVSRPRRRHLDAPANVLLLATLWFGYAMVRKLTGDTQLVAVDNASRLLDVETRLGIDIEGALQSALDWPQAFVAANTYYLLHFPLTLAVMVLAFWRSRATVFSVLRNSLIGCTAVALVVHFFVPMAPPRMLPGFVDAGSAYGPDPYAIAGSDSANQFAAMPSMHVAWAILAGYAIWRLSARPIVRILGTLHPVLTSLVVIVTGHHFVSDVAIGAGLAFALLFCTTRLAHRRGAPVDVDVLASCVCSRPVVISAGDTVAHRSADLRPARTRRLAEPRSHICRTTVPARSFTLNSKRQPADSGEKRDPCTGYIHTTNS